MKKVSSYPALYEHVAMRAMFQFFGREFADLPEITEEMLRFGESRSPEYSCFPVKVYVGYFKEVAKTGVNDIFIPGIRNHRACRYVDMFTFIQKAVREEGYPEFTIHYWGGYGLKWSFERLQKIMGGPSYPRMVIGLKVYFDMLRATDYVNDLANKSRPREAKPGSTDKWLKTWIAELKKVNKGSQIPKIKKDAKAAWDKIETDNSRQIIRLALAGDLFKIHEPFFHFDTIRKLNELGVEVRQPLSFSLLFYGMNKVPSADGYAKKYREYSAKSKKYLKSMPASYVDIGVGEVVDDLEKGAEGIIHFQSFGCMPDIMFRPIFDRIGQDFDVPVIHYMRDSHASDTAYQTRLEAFVDLIKRKQNV